MVAAASNHDVHFVEWEMPWAQGLQYQAIWLDMHGIITERMGEEFDTAAKWKEIAGL